MTKFEKQTSLAAFLSTIWSVVFVGHSRFTIDLTIEQNKNRQKSPATLAWMYTGYSVVSKSNVLWQLATVETCTSASPLHWSESRTLCDQHGIPNFRFIVGSHLWCLKETGQHWLSAIECILLHHWQEHLITEDPTRNYISNWSTFWK